MWIITFDNRFVIINGKYIIPRTSFSNGATQHIL